MSPHRVVLAALIGAALIIATVLLIWPVRAHEAPTGWQYDASCCSSIDCGQAPAGDVTETPDGYFLQSNGELIPYGDPRIKRSKDEFFHECKPGGIPTSKRSFCLYVPDRGY